MIFNPIVSGRGTQIQLATIIATGLSVQYVTLNNSVLTANRGEGTLNVVMGSEMVALWHDSSPSVSGDIELTRFNDNGYPIYLVNGNGTISGGGGGGGDLRVSGD